MKSTNLVVIPLPKLVHSKIDNILETKNNNTNVTIIKPGYFKTGSDKENEDNASYLKYNNGKM